jgi:hypothetical protein
MSDETSKRLTLVEGDPTDGMTFGEEVEGEEVEADESSPATDPLGSAVRPAEGLRPS